MVQNGPKRSRMVQTVQNGPKRSRMIPNGSDVPKWSRTVQNGPNGQKWSKTVQNGPKWFKRSKMVQFGPDFSCGFPILKFQKDTFFWDTLYAFTIGWLQLCFVNDCVRVQQQRLSEIFQCRNHNHEHTLKEGTAVLNFIQICTETDKTCKNAVVVVIYLSIFHQEA